MSGIKSQANLQTRELAKQDYLDGHITIEQIALKHDIPHDTLKDWIKNGRYGDLPWSYIKKERQVAAKRELMDKATVHLPGVFNTGLEILNYAFSKVRDGLTAGMYEGRELDVIKGTVDSILKVYKIIRLDENKSTTNVAVATEKINAPEVTKELKNYMENLIGEAIEVETE